MIKKYKSYFLLFGLIIVLSGAYFILSNIKGGEKDENKIDLRNQEAIFKIERDQIKSIKINNKYGSYTLSYEDKMKISELPDAAVDENKIDSLAYEMVEFKPESIVFEKADNLAVYGLDNQNTTLSVEDKSGNITTFILGAVSPVGNGYYGMIKGSDTVYIFASYKSELFLRKSSYYRNNQLLSVDKNNILEFSVEKNNGYSIKFIKNIVTDTETPNNFFASYRMVSPYDWDAEGSEISKIFDSIIDIKAEDFIEDSLSNKEKYGFNPYNYKIAIKLENKYETVYIGNAFDDKYYIMIENLNGIYAVKSGSFSYLNLEPTAFLQKFAYIKNLDTVKSINYNHYGVANAYFEITKIDEESHDIKKDGKSISEEEFKKLYTELISISTGGPVDYKPTGEPYLTYEFNFIDGTKDIVNYHKIDDRRYALSINGKIQFYVNHSELSPRLKIIDELILK